MILFRRKVQELFPLFVSYIAASVFASLARLVVFNYPYIRFYVYWTTELLLILLSLAALNHVFWKTYEGFRFLLWFRALYYGAILLALGITIRMAIVSPPVQAHPIAGFVIDAELTANMVRGGIVALFAVLVGPMVVQFQRYPFGIILGFGASSIGPILSFFSLSVSGTKYREAARIFSAVSYIAALVIWLRIFSLPDTEPIDWEPPIPPEEMVGTVDRYLKALGVSRKRKRTK